MESSGSSRSEPVDEDKGKDKDGDKVMNEGKGEEVAGDKDENEGVPGGTLHEVIQAFINDSSRYPELYLGIENDVTIPDEDVADVESFESLKPVGIALPIYDHDMGGPSKPHANSDDDFLEINETDPNSKKTALIKDGNDTSGRKSDDTDTSLQVGTESCTEVDSSKDHFGCSNEGKIVDVASCGPYVVRAISGEENPVISSTEQQDSASSVNTLKEYIENFHPFLSLDETETETRSDTSLVLQATCDPSMPVLENEIEKKPTVLEGSRPPVLQPEGEMPFLIASKENLGGNGVILRQGISAGLAHVIKDDRLKKKELLTVQNIVQVEVCQSKQKGKRKRRRRKTRRWSQGRKGKVLPNMPSLSPERKEEEDSYLPAVPGTSVSRTTGKVHKKQLGRSGPFGGNGHRGVSTAHVAPYRDDCTELKDSTVNSEDIPAKSVAEERQSDIETFELGQLNTETVGKRVDSEEENSFIKARQLNPQEFSSSIEVKQSNLGELNSEGVNGYEGISGQMHTGLIACQEVVIGVPSSSGLDDSVPTSVVESPEEFKSPEELLYRYRYPDQVVPSNPEDDYPFLNIFSKSSSSNTLLDGRKTTNVTCAGSGDDNTSFTELISACLNSSVEQLNNSESDNHEKLYEILKELPGGDVLTKTKERQGPCLSGRNEDVLLSSEFSLKEVGSKDSSRCEFEVDTRSKTESASTPDEEPNLLAVENCYKTPLKSLESHETSDRNVISKLIKPFSVLHLEGVIISVSSVDSNENNTKDTELIAHNDQKHSFTTDNCGNKVDNLSICEKEGGTSMFPECARRVCDSEELGSISSCVGSVSERQSVNKKEEAESKTQDQAVAVTSSGGVDIFDKFKSCIEELKESLMMVNIFGKSASVIESNEKRVQPESINMNKKQESIFVSSININLQKDDVFQKDFQIVQNSDSHSNISDGALATCVESLNSFKTQDAEHLKNGYETKTSVIPAKLYDSNSDVTVDVAKVMEAEVVSEDSIFLSKSCETEVALKYQTIPDISREILTSVTPLAKSSDCGDDLEDGISWIIKNDKSDEPEDMSSACVNGSEIVISVASEEILSNPIESMELVKWNSANDLKNCEDVSQSVQDLKTSECGLENLDMLSSGISGYSCEDLLVISAESVLSEDTPKSPELPEVQVQLANNAPESRVDGISEKCEDILIMSAEPILSKANMREDIPKTPELLKEEVQYVNCAPESRMVGISENCEEALVTSAESTLLEADMGVEKSRLSELLDLQLDLADNAPESLMDGISEKSEEALVKSAGSPLPEANMSKDIIDEDIPKSPELPEVKVQLAYNTPDSLMDGVAEKGEECLVMSAESTLPEANRGEDISTFSEFLEEQVDVANNVPESRVDGIHEKCGDTAVMSAESRISEDNVTKDIIDEDIPKSPELPEVKVQLANNTPDSLMDGVAEKGEECLVMSAESTLPEANRGEDISTFSEFLEEQVDLANNVPESRVDGIHEKCGDTAVTSAESRISEDNVTKDIVEEDLPKSPERSEIKVQLANNAPDSLMDGVTEKSEEALVMSAESTLPEAEMGEDISTFSELLEEQVDLANNVPESRVVGIHEKRGDTLVMFPRSPLPETISKDIADEDIPKSSELLEVKLQLANNAPKSIIDGISEMCEETLVLSAGSPIPDTNRSKDIADEDIPKSPELVEVKLQLANNAPESIIDGISEMCEKALVVSAGSSVPEANMTKDIVDEEIPKSPKLREIQVQLANNAPESSVDIISEKCEEVMAEEPMEREANSPKELTDFSVEPSVALEPPRTAQSYDPLQNQAKKYSRSDYIQITSEHTEPLQPVILDIPVNLTFSKDKSPKEDVTICNKSEEITLFCGEPLRPVIVDVATELGKKELTSCENVSPLDEDMTESTGIPPKLTEPAQICDLDDPKGLITCEVILKNSKSTTKQFTKSDSNFLFASNKPDHILKPLRNKSKLNVNRKKQIEPVKCCIVAGGSGERDAAKGSVSSSNPVDAESNNGRLFESIKDGNGATSVEYLSEPQKEMFNKLKIKDYFSKELSSQRKQKTNGDLEEIKANNIFPPRDDGVANKVSVQVGQTNDQSTFPKLSQLPINGDISMSFVVASEHFSKLSANHDSSSAFLNNFNGRRTAVVFEKSKSNSTLDYSILGKKEIFNKEKGKINGDLSSQNGFAVSPGERSMLYIGGDGYIVLDEVGTEEDEEMEVSVVEVKPIKDNQWICPTRHGEGNIDKIEDGKTGAKNVYKRTSCENSRKKGVGLYFLRINREDPGVSRQYKRNGLKRRRMVSNGDMEAERAGEGGSCRDPRLKHLVSAVRQNIQNEILQNGKLSETSCTKYQLSSSEHINRKTGVLVQTLLTEDNMTTTKKRKTVDNSKHLNTHYVRNGGKKWKHLTEGRSISMSERKKPSSEGLLLERQITSQKSVRWKLPQARKSSEKLNTPINKDCGNVKFYGTEIRKQHVTNELILAVNETTVSELTEQKITVAAHEISENENNNHDQSQKVVGDIGTSKGDITQQEPAQHIIVTTDSGIAQQVLSQENIVAVDLPSESERTQQHEYPENTGGGDKKSVDEAAPEEQSQKSDIGDEKTDAEVVPEEQSQENIVDRDGTSEDEVAQEKSVICDVTSECAIAQEKQSQDKSDFCDFTSECAVVQEDKSQEKSDFCDVTSECAVAQEEQVQEKSDICDVTSQCEVAQEERSQEQSGVCDVTSEGEVEPEQSDVCDVTSKSEVAQEKSDICDVTPECEVAQKEQSQETFVVCDVTSETELAQEKSGVCDVTSECEVAQKKSNICDVTSVGEVAQEKSGVCDVTSEGDLAQETSEVCDVTSGGEVAQEQSGVCDVTSECEVAQEQSGVCDVTYVGEVAQEERSQEQSDICDVSFECEVALEQSDVCDVTSEGEVTQEERSQEQSDICDVTSEIEVALEQSDVCDVTSEGEVAQEERSQEQSGVCDVTSECEVAQEQSDVCDVTSKGEVAQEERSQEQSDICDVSFEGEVAQKKRSQEQSAVCDVTSECEVAQEQSDVCDVTSKGEVAQEERSQEQSDICDVSFEGEVAQEKRSQEQSAVCDVTSECEVAQEQSDVCDVTSKGEVAQEERSQEQSDICDVSFECEVALEQSDVCDVTSEGEVAQEERSQEHSDICDVSFECEVALEQSDVCDVSSECEVAQEQSDVCDVTSEGEVAQKSGVCDVTSECEVAQEQSDDCDDTSEGEVAQKSGVSDVTSEGEVAQEERSQELSDICDVISECEVAQEQSDVCYVSPKGELAQEKSGVCDVTSECEVAQEQSGVCDVTSESEVAQEKFVVCDVTSENEVAQEEQSQETFVVCDVTSECEVAQEQQSQEKSDICDVTSECGVAQEKSGVYDVTSENEVAQEEQSQETFVVCDVTSEFEVAHEQSDVCDVTSECEVAWEQYDICDVTSECEVAQEDQSQEKSVFCDGTSECEVTQDQQSQEMSLVCVGTSECEVAQEDQSQEKSVFCDGTSECEVTQDQQSQEMYIVCVGTSECEVAQENQSLEKFVVCAGISEGDIALEELSQKSVVCDVTSVVEVHQEELSQENITVHDLPSDELKMQNPLLNDVSKDPEFRTSGEVEETSHDIAAIDSIVHGDDDISKNEVAEQEVNVERNAKDVTKQQGSTWKQRVTQVVSCGTHIIDYKCDSDRGVVCKDCISDMSGPGCHIDVEAQSQGKIRRPNCKEQMHLVEGSGPGNEVLALPKSFLKNRFLMYGGKSYDTAYDYAELYCLNIITRCFIRLDRMDQSTLQIILKSKNEGVMSIGLDNPPSTALQLCQNARGAGKRTWEVSKLGDLAEARRSKEARLSCEDSPSATPHPTSQEAMLTHQLFHPRKYTIFKSKNSSNVPKKPVIPLRLVSSKDAGGNTEMAVDMHPSEYSVIAPRSKPVEKDEPTVSLASEKLLPTDHGQSTFPENNSQLSEIVNIKDVVTCDQEQCVNMMLGTAVHVNEDSLTKSTDTTPESTENNVTNTLSESVEQSSSSEKNILTEIIDSATDPSENQLELDTLDFDPNRKVYRNPKFKDWHKEMMKEAEEKMIANKIDCSQDKVLSEGKIPRKGGPKKCKRRGSLKGEDKHGRLRRTEIEVINSESEEITQNSDKHSFSPDLKTFLLTNCDELYRRNVIRQCTVLLERLDESALARASGRKVAESGTVIGPARRRGRPPKRVRRVGGSSVRDVRSMVHLVATDTEDALPQQLETAATSSIALETDPLPLKPPPLDGPCKLPSPSSSSDPLTSTSDRLIGRSDTLSSLDTREETVGKVCEGRATNPISSPSNDNVPDSSTRNLSLVSDNPSEIPPIKDTTPVFSNKSSTNYAPNPVLPIEDPDVESSSESEMMKTDFGPRFGERRLNTEERTFHGSQKADFPASIPGSSRSFIPSETPSNTNASLIFSKEPSNYYSPNHGPPREDSSVESSFEFEMLQALLANALGGNGSKRNNFRTRFLEQGPNVDDQFFSRSQRGAGFSHGIPDRPRSFFSWSNYFASLPRKRPKNYNEAPLGEELFKKMCCSIEEDDSRYDYSRLRNVELDSNKLEKILNILDGKPEEQSPSGTSKKDEEGFSGFTDCLIPSHLPAHCTTCKRKYEIAQLDIANVKAAMYALSRTRPPPRTVEERTQQNFPPTHPHRRFEERTHLNLPQTHLPDRTAEERTQQNFPRTHPCRTAEERTQVYFSPSNSKEEGGIYASQVATSHSNLGYPHKSLSTKRPRQETDQDESTLSLMKKKR